MSAKRFRTISVIMSMVLLSATLQSCGVIEEVFRGLARICEQPVFVVTKTLDTNDGICTSGDCSLREAIVTANNCPGHQTIQLPAGGYRLTLLGAGEDAALTGDLDITDDLTILGEGAPSIHGQDDDRTIDVFSPATVVIDGVILTDGAASEGSAAYNSGDLTLRNSSVNANNAVVPPGGGTVTGALANEGTLVLVDTQVFDNQGGFGAGVHNLTGGRFDMVGGIISFNTAGGSGGGLWISEASTASLENVIVEGNSAIGDGGGIASMGNLDILDSEVIDNRVGQHGGGLWTTFSSLTSLLNTPVERNAADMDGGGIFNNGDLTLSEVGLNQNTAGVAGGGLVNDNGGVANIGNSNINENEASQAGGVFNDGELNFERVTVSGNTTVGQGGGILNRTRGTLIASMLEVSGNQAGRDGGGIATHWESTTNLRNSSISSNTAGRIGGGVYNEGSFIYERGSILSNEAMGSSAALYVSAPSASAVRASAVLRNVTIDGNIAPSNQSAISAFETVEMFHVTLSNNASIGLSGSAISMFNSVLEDNSAGNCSSITPPSFVTEIGNLDSDGTCGLSGLSGVSALLLPLVSDGLGGVGSVHPLDPTSPAIDAASDLQCLPVDQRLSSRPQGPACDIGAYEFEVASESSSAEPTAVAPIASPTPVGLPPIDINFNADSYSIVAGECTRLRWDVKNAENVTLDGVVVPVLEAEQVCPPSPQTYKMIASNSIEEVERFVTIEVTPLVTPPKAPEQLHIANQVCSGQTYSVTLGWIDAADDEDGYRVYRDGNLIANLGSNAKGFTDTPHYGGPYSYGVEAFNSAGSSSRLTVQEVGCIY